MVPGVDTVDRGRGSRPPPHTDPPAIRDSEYYVGPEVSESRGLWTSSGVMVRSGWKCLCVSGGISPCGTCLSRRQ